MRADEVAKSAEKQPQVPCSPPDREVTWKSISPTVMIGFGLHWAWVFITMYAASSLLVFGPTFVNGRTFYIISMLAFVSTWITYGVVGEKASWIRRGRNQTIAAAVMCSGTVMILSAGLGPAALRTILVVLAGVTTGLGSSTLLMCWGDTFKRRGLFAATFNSTGGILLAYLVYTLVFSPLSAVALAIPLVLFPFIEVACLIRAARQDASSSVTDPSGKIETIPMFDDLKIKRARFALRIGLPSLLFGFALGALRETVLITTPRNFSGAGIPLLILGAVVGSALFLASMYAVRNRDYENSYRTLIPLVAIVLFIGPLAGSGSSASRIVLITVVVCFELLMWVAFTTISHTYRISPMLVFGFGRGFLALGTLMGVLAGDFLGLNFSAIGFTRETNLLSVLLFLGYILLPSERDIAAVVAVPVDAEASTAARERELAEAMRPAAKSGLARNPNAFRERCQRIADTFLLSKRETEVFYLLAKGRNAAFIQQQFHIAEGTVRTHTWRIYQKLDIHSQQELIDLIDSEWFREKDEADWR